MAIGKEHPDNWRHLAASEILVAKLLGSESDQSSRQGQTKAEISDQNSSSGPEWVVTRMGFCRLSIAMRKLMSYLLFIAVGVAKNARSGHPCSFIAGEVNAKMQRFKNKNKIGETRRRFDATPPSDYVYDASPLKLEKLHVFSLCQRGATPEQKLSILSFLRHVGSPAKWSIVSDGTISASQAESLRSIHPSIDVVDWRTFLCEENRVCFERLSKYTVYAKKFALMSNLPDAGAVVYVDTDILFFEGAQHFVELLKNLGEKSYYQKDLLGCLDGSFLTKSELEAPPLNAGFLVQGKRLDWSVPIARLKRTLSQLMPVQSMGDLGILEQSACHLAHYLAGSIPLDEKYVLEISDRFDVEDRFAGPNFVMRHYVRPVRHKMWVHSRDYLR